MPKFQFKDLTSRTAAFFKQKVLPRLSRLPDYLVLFVSSWWHVILIAFAALVFLYYPIGGLMVSSIDTNTSYEIKEPETNQSATVDMMAFIINREVNEKMWTPNLPFNFFSFFFIGSYLTRYTDNLTSYWINWLNSYSILTFISTLSYL